MIIFVGGGAVINIDYVNAYFWGRLHQILKRVGGGITFVQWSENIKGKRCKYMFGKCN